MILEIAAGPDGSTTELKLGTLVLACTTLVRSMKWGVGTLNLVARIEANSGPGSFLTLVHPHLDRCYRHKNYESK